MATPVGGTPPPDTTPPSAPGTLSATAVSTSQINLSWGAATDNVGVTSYLVERCQSAGCSNFTQITTTTGTTFNNTGLTAATSYSYRVRATDAANNPGPFSNVASATTQAAPDTTPPSAPGTLTVTAVSTSRIDLSWGAATDNVGVTGYLVERCQNAGCSNFAQITTTTGTTFSNTGLLTGTSYSYRVRATDAANNPGPFSNTATASTQGSTGLVAAYGFGENTGSLLGDSSGNGNHGSITGASWTTQGQFGSALSFNGTSSFVTVPDAASLDLTTTGTMEAWVRLAGLNRWHGVIAKGNANSDPAHNYAIEIDNANRVICGLGNGATSRVLASTVTLAANQFYHLACTWNGTTLALYINGTLNTSIAQNITPAGNTAPLFIGQFGGNSDRLSGIVDEVRLYTRALTPAEIQADRTTPIP
jgi:chitodextrinase